MNIERDQQNNIIVRDNNDQEIHPYVTILAAIEFQQRVIPPEVPRLNSQGWDVVVLALKECIMNLGNPYKITDMQVEIAKDGTVSEIISVEPVQNTISVPKTPEMPEIDTNNPPDTVVPAPTNAKKTNSNIKK